MCIFPKREGNMPISLKPSWIYIFSNIMRNLPWNPTNVNSLCKKVRHLQTTVKKKHSSLLALEFLVFRTLLFCQKKKQGQGQCLFHFWERSTHQLTRLGSAIDLTHLSLCLTRVTYGDVKGFWRMVTSKYRGLSISGGAGFLPSTV